MNFIKKVNSHYACFLRIKTVFFTFFALFCVNVLFSGSAFCQTISKEIQPIVDEVGEIIKDKYIVSDVETKYLSNGAVDGMLRSLDPYSAYFDAEDYKSFQNNTDGKFFGIGIEMVGDVNSDCPVITNVFDNSPAKEAGLLIGDVITHINDIAVNGKKQTVVAKMIKGEKGTQVKLTLYRLSTGETFSKFIRRNEVKIPSVISKIYRDKIAIVEIKLFNQQTYNSFVSQINEIRRQYDISGLILDLRNNPGGLLESAVDIANLFLTDGQLITSVKGRNNVKTFDYIARNKSNVFNDVNVAILINKGSASASEILAGCLQDYGIATLIGERTFGKALVQEVFQLKKTDGAVKITTGQYHTPKDKQINGVGIEPDIKVNERRTKKFDAILQAGLNFLSKKESKNSV